MADEVSSQDPIFGTSVLSRIKVFESQAENGSSASGPARNSTIRSPKLTPESSTSSTSMSNSRLNGSNGAHDSTEEDWVNVNVGLGGMGLTGIGNLGKLTLAPPLPARKTSSSSLSNHAPASSVSSFHSVSLSSDSIAILPEKEEDTTSLDSYEDVDSTTSFGSPGAVERLTADWNQLKQKKPPSFPSRSASSSSSSPIPSSSTTSLPGSSVSRRPAPPPPTTHVGPASDRSSMISTPSTANSIANGYPPSYVPYKPKPPPPPPPNKSVPLPTLKLTNSLSNSSTNSNSTDRSVRATPIPHLARKRYEAVFDANLANYNLLGLAPGSSSSKPSLLSPTSAMGHDRKGWRGLSIDLITSPEQEGLEGLDLSGSTSPGGEPIKNNKLPGAIVHVIWSKSRLGKERLSAIWLQSDPNHTGSLDREAFVRGMWKIDAELSTELVKNKTQSRQSSTLTTTSLTRTPTQTKTATPPQLGFGRPQIPISMQRNPSTSSSHSSSSSHNSYSSHGLRTVRSAGSLRRTSPVPAPVPIPGLPSPTHPPPLLPTRPPTRTSTMQTQTTTPMIPPPLPARKPTNPMGVGMGGPEDELDLLL